MTRCITVLVLALALIVPAFAEAGLARKCMRNCRYAFEAHAVCGLENPTYTARKCRKVTVRRCRREGLQVCLPPTTTTTVFTGPTTTTTTTTLPPRTAVGVFADSRGSVRVTATVANNHVSLAVVGLTGQFFFCTPFLDVVQNGQVMQLSAGSHPNYGYLRWDGTFDGCDTVYAGVSLTAQLVEWLPWFDASQSFTLHHESFMLTVP